MVAPEPPLEFVPTMGYGPATIESVEETLQQALDLLDDGASWAQDGLRVAGGAADGGLAFCAVGALEAAAPNYDSYAYARDALKQAAGENHIDRWNNSATWQDVKQALEQAISNVDAQLVFGTGGVPLPPHIRPK